MNIGIKRWQILAAVGFVIMAVGFGYIALELLSGDDAAEHTFTGDAQLSDKATSFTSGPFSGMAEPDWFPIYLVLQDVNTATPAATKGQGVKAVVENFFNQPSVTHVFYMFFEDVPEFSSSMNILRCEPPGATEVTGNVENLLKFYKENNIEARSVGTATYNSANYDILKVELAEGYDTYIVPLKTGDCVTPATLITKEGDTSKVDKFRAALSKLTIDATKLPR
jgi:hypothetical protein